MIDTFSDDELAYLLDRKPSANNVNNANLKSKVVVVTGAGGTVGSELCIQLLTANVSTLVLIEHSEFALYEIYETLINLQKVLKAPATEVVPRLVSVLDEAEMFNILSIYRPNIMYHAAAYKHVHMVEMNSRVGIKNNVLGTHITSKLANHFGVDQYILVSSDKAINPINVMGYSKLMSEKIILSVADNTHTKFYIARFGNILGSSGSVLPKFIKQLKAGLPVSISNPESSRFFMLKAEAINLLLEIVNLNGISGTRYCFDMGEKIKILNLAERLHALLNSWSTPLQVEYHQSEPYERIHEESVITPDTKKTSHPKIFQMHSDLKTKPDLEAILAEALKLSELGRN